MRSQPSQTKFGSSQGVTEMDRSIVLRLDVLRRALGLVLEELEAIHGDVLRLDNDYFWSIPAEQRMNVYEQPKDCLLYTSDAADD